MRTGAVISAAGHKSSVSTFDPLMPIGQTTVIRRIIMTLKHCGVDPIVVITGKDAKTVEKHISKLRVICLRNTAYDSSQMFDSVGIGLRYLEDLCDRILIMPVKFPKLLPETIKEVMESGSKVACPVYEGKRGHPVLIDKSVIPSVLSYRGEGGLRGLFKQQEFKGLIEEILVEDKGIIDPIESDQDTRSQPYIGYPIIHPSTSLFLESDEVFFGPDMAQFLMLIEHTGSMQTACRQMNMSYSKGFKLLRGAEKQLGFPLLITQSGGVEGGFSKLTPKAADLLQRFLLMEKELSQKAEELFNQYFKEVLV